MTVCIAASCDSGRQVVVAADQMVTVGAPLNVEFEPPLSKIEQMGASCVALGAGNTLYIAEILKQAREAYQNAQATPVTQIANAICQTYRRFRDERVEEQVVLPIVGPDFVSFRNRGGTLPAYLQPQPAIYQQIVVQMSQFNLGVDIAIAGIDAGGSHIYYVGNPGTVASFEKLGYTSIGTGATHVAIKFVLELQHPNSTLAETLVSVYGAKKAAEVAPGVGQETEIKVISLDKIWTVPGELVALLKKAHSEREQKSKPDLTEIQKKYDGLRKNG
jgi:hypothetical protein